MGSSAATSDGAAYNLDNVFGSASRTRDVYDSTTRGIIASVVGGFNGTVFAYGQTSSGKTHTMQGTAEEPGIIPLAVRDVFDRISNENGLCTYRNMLQVLYPGASNEQVNIMLQMSKSEADQILQRARERGPSKEQVEQAKNVFNTYNLNKDGCLSEEEFAKGLSATGVYSHEVRRCRCEPCV